MKRHEKFSHVNMVFALFSIYWGEISGCSIVFNCVQLTNIFRRCSPGILVEMREVPDDIGSYGINFAGNSRDVQEAA